jgi:hypothetical protein
VAYDTDPGEANPEDVHVDYRELSPPLFTAPWKPILDADVVGINFKNFEIPLSPAPPAGTYDVRVRWTRKRRNRQGEVVGEEPTGSPEERIGQFFVDEPT